MSCTVKAIAKAAGYNLSAILSKTFTIQTSKPGLTPNGGTHTGPDSDTIADSTPGAVIWYTTDGTTPAVGGGGTAVTYSGAFMVSPGTTVTSIAQAPGTLPSAVSIIPFN